MHNIYHIELYYFLVSKCYRFDSDCVNLTLAWNLLFFFLFIIRWQYAHYYYSFKRVLRKK